MNDANSPLDNDVTCDNGLEEQTHLEHDESGQYAVYIYPDTGAGSLGPVRKSELTRYPRRKIRLPQSVLASARASRKRLRDHAVRHQLGACLMLTYAALPTDPKGDVERFVRKAKNYYPYRMHYAVTTEGKDPSCGIRIHHNVILPASPHLADIAGMWPHGDVFIGINPTDRDIRRMVNYISKEFVRSSGLEARFIKSKFKAPKPLKKVFDNKDDAVSALISHIPSDATGVYVYNPHCAERVIAYWDVNKHQM